MKKIVLTLMMILVLGLGLTACTSRKPDAPAGKSEQPAASAQDEEDEEEYEEEEGDEGSEEYEEDEEEELEYALDLNEDDEFGIYVVRDALDDFTIVMTYEGQTGTPKEFVPSNEEFELLDQDVALLAQDKGGEYTFHVVVKDDQGKVRDEKDFTYSLSEPELYLVILGDGTIWNQDEAEEMV